CEPEWILDARDGVRPVADERPALPDARKEFWTILEPGAPHGTARRPRGRELLERFDHFVAVHAVPQAAGETTVRVRPRDRVGIAEIIRHQRRKSRAARGRRKRTAGGGSNQHGVFTHALSSRAS